MTVSVNKPDDVELEAYFVLLRWAEFGLQVGSSRDEVGVIYLRLDDGSPKSQGGLLNAGCIQDVFFG